MMEQKLAPSAKLKNLLQLPTEWRMKSLMLIQGTGIETVTSVLTHTHIPTTTIANDRVVHLNENPPQKQQERREHELAIVQ